VFVAKEARVSMPKEHRNEMVQVLVEFFKLLICLGLVIFRSSNACLELYDELWIKRREAGMMAIPVLYLLLPLRRHATSARRHA